MATHCSILAWRTPWAEQPGGLLLYRVAKSQAWLKWLSTECYSWQHHLQTHRWKTTSVSIRVGLLPTFDTRAQISCSEFSQSLPCKASGSGLTKRHMRGEQSRRAALGLQAGVWQVSCMPRACAAHSQQAQHSPCRSAALPSAGSAHPSQVQAWLYGKGCQLSSSSPEWSATEVVRERHGFTLSSRLPDCSWCTLETWCCQPPWLQIP